MRVGTRKVKGMMLEESAYSREASWWAEQEGGRLCTCAPPGVMLCFSPQGRTTEPPAPLQTSIHPRWSQDEGFRPHDPVPGVLGGGQALCTPASQRQHDHGERQDQHHGTPSPCPSAGRKLVPQKPSPAKVTFVCNEASSLSPTSQIGILRYSLQISGYQWAPTPHC